MKILYVANDVANFIGKFYFPEMERLSQEGNTVLLACSLNGPVPSFVKTYPMPWTRNPFKGGLHKGIKEVRALIEQEKPDLVVTITAVGGLVGRLGAHKVKSYHPAVIYFNHGFHFSKAGGFKSYLLYYPVEKWLSKKTDLLVSINGEDYAVAKEKFHAQETALVNGIGVDVAKYQDHVLTPEKRAALEAEIPLKGHAPILFYAAELSQNKNQRYLLKVVDALKAQGLNPLLILAGRDLTKGKLPRLIQKKYADNVVYLGFRKDCPDLLRLADFVVPSSLREGLPMNLVESEATGVPLVATHNRGHDAVIKEGVTGYLVSPKHPAEMASKIASLWANPTLRSALSAAEKADCVRFSFDSVYPVIKGLYEGALKYERK
jgi:glycosyltransferase EpsD